MKVHYWLIFRKSSACGLGSRRDSRVIRKHPAIDCRRCLAWPGRAMKKSPEAK